MDTSTARQAIFDRIRNAHGVDATSLDARRAAARDTLRNRSQGPRPALGPDLLLRFRQQALRMSDTLDEVGSEAEAPRAVAGYLARNGLAPRAVAWNGLGGLPWADAGVEVECRVPHGTDLVGITGAFCAVAETGTLVLLSGPDTCASASLLPETHIALLPAERIVAGMEDAFALVRAERGALPRALNFISGPSRTGDIEQTIVLGAHGPYRVHVVIVHGGLAR